MFLNYSSSFNLSRDVSWEQVLQQIQPSPKAFFAKVKKASTKPEMNLVMQWSTTKKLRQTVQVHVCELCSRECKSQHDLALHLFNDHKVKSSICNYVGNETICAGCLQQYHSRTRLLGHLRDRSERCRVFYKLYSQFLTDDQIRPFEDEDALLAREFFKQGKSRYLAECPPVNAMGPLHPSSMLLGIRSIPRLSCHYEWSSKAFQK